MIFVKRKQFNVKKLFVTQACLHVLHYMYLYMSSLCCSQKRRDQICSVKSDARLNETFEPALRTNVVNTFTPQLRVTNCCNCIAIGHKDIAILL